MVVRQEERGVVVHILGSDIAVRARPVFWGRAVRRERAVSRGGLQELGTSGSGAVMVYHVVPSVAVTA